MAPEITPGHIRILLVDDHQMFIDGIKTLLRNEDSLAVTLEANSGEQAIRMLETNASVDIIITDISMPGISGTDLTRLVKEKFPHIRVLVLTMYNDMAILREIMAAGAEGYILKNSGKKELTDAIYKIADHGTYYSTEVLSGLLQNGKTQAKNAVELTEREIEIIRLITSEFSSKEIAEKLCISPRTVDTHRQNIMEKIGVRSVVGIIKYAFEQHIVQ